MPKLDRESYNSVESYLFHLYNDLGCIDLEMCYNYKFPDGTVAFSKWIRFDILMNLDYNDIVKGTNDTKRKFLDKVTHRSVLDIEVLYDFDEDENGSQIREDIYIYAKKCISNMEKNGIYGETFSTGSKGIHHSVFYPELRSFSKSVREKHKFALLRTYKIIERHNVIKHKFASGEPKSEKDSIISFSEKKTDISADLNKKSNRCMIALEESKHWKSGKIKKRIKL